MSEAIPQVAPTDLKKEIEGGANIFLLDVREASEFKIVALPRAYHVPLGELRHRYEDLEADDDIVVYCHRGIRSAQAVTFLRAKGFTRVRNLAGGIDHWAETVEPIKRY